MHDALRRKSASAAAAADGCLVAGVDLPPFVAVDVLDAGHRHERLARAQAARSCEDCRRQGAGCHLVECLFPPPFRPPPPRLCARHTGSLSLLCVNTVSV